MLSLPDVSGLQIIQALLIFFDALQTYIVVATIYDDDKNLLAALKSGTQGYILRDQSKETMVSYPQDIIRGITLLSFSIVRKVVQYFNAKGVFLQEISLIHREERVLKSIAKVFSFGEKASMLARTTNMVKGYV